MSNNHSATMQQAAMAAPAPATAAAVAGPRKPLWRRFYEAWLRSYESRVDHNGNIIMCE